MLVNLSASISRGHSRDNRTTSFNESNETGGAVL